MSSIVCRIKGWFLVMTLYFVDCLIVLVRQIIFLLQPKALEYLGNPTFYRFADRCPTNICKVIKRQQRIGIREISGKILVADILILAINAIV